MEIGRQMGMRERETDRGSQRQANRVGERDRGRDRQTEREGKRDTDGSQRQADRGRERETSASHLDGKVPLIPEIRLESSDQPGSLEACRALAASFWALLGPGILGQPNPCLVPSDTLTRVGTVKPSLSVRQKGH